MKIVQISDVHIHNLIRHEEYREVFKKLYEKLREIKPDKIVIVGDLFENFITLTNESKLLAGEFLTELSKIAKVIITMGNHDFYSKNSTRIDSIKVIVKLLNNSNITYFDKTGLYDDNDLPITWVVYHHPDRNIDPWENNIKDDEQIHIGLYHEAVYDCTSDLGKVFNSPSTKPITYFKNNDFLFCGHIHKFQYLREDKSAAFAGSTIQQDFGELPKNHGFLLWNINSKDDFSSKHISISNDCSYHNFYLDKPDYDNLELDTQPITKVMNVKVHWTDYSSNVNNLENEQKIKDYIKEKFATELVKFEKKHIHKNIADSDELNESININDKSVQKKIFSEYLLANKYDENFIKEILKIDEMIDNRMQLTTTIDNIDWSIGKMWLDNFKSYDKIEIDWNDIHGSIQIGGENQNGKSNIFDAICYILFGTTLYTNTIGGAKRTKYADNKFINNRRDLDYCEGGMVINVSGQLYTIVRKTERTWNKTKGIINAVSTNMEIYDGPEVDEEKKLRDETKQKKINAILGEFEDFVRLTLTTSTNLNDLLSIDRAKFIDSMINDTGLGIFEKKLNEFKEYKKELKDVRISLNLTEAEKSIQELTTKFKSYETEISNINNDINLLDGKIKQIDEKRDLQFSKLNKVDEEIASIDVNSINKTLEDYKELINNNLNTQKINLERTKTLKSEYDAEGLENKLKESKRLEDQQLILKLKISQAETSIEKEKSNISMISNNEKNIVSQNIQEERKKIEEKLLLIKNKKSEIDSVLSKISSKIKDELKDVDFEIKTLNSEISNIKEKGIGIKKQIKELEESKTSKICPTCQRPYEDDEHIKNKIENFNKEIEVLTNKIKDRLAKLKELEPKVEDYKSKLTEIEDGTFDSKELKDKKTEIKNFVALEEGLIFNIEESIKEIENGNYTTELIEKLNKYKEEKIVRNQNIEKYKSTIVSLNSNIKENQDLIWKLQPEIQKLQSEQEEVKKHLVLVAENKELSLKIENYKLIIENAKNKIDKYYSQLEKIEENKAIQKEIDELNNLKSNYDFDKTDLIDKKSTILQDAGIIKTSIKDLKEKITKYKEQCKRDAELKEYENCISRDGIPSFLLKKSVHLINEELESLLANVDFVAYFDDDLQLKMSPTNNRTIVQDALSCCGKEKSFMSVTLKLALRSINNKSKANFILFDEIMAAFTKKSAEEFYSMLDNAKKKIDKIIIIENNHDIPYDYIIEAVKDKDGVSKINLN